MVGVEEGEAMVLVDDVTVGSLEKWDTTVSCPIWWKRWGGWMFVCDGDVDRVQVRDQTESCGQRLFQLRLGQREMFGGSGCRIQSVNWRGGEYLGMGRGRGHGGLGDGIGLGDDAVWGVERQGGIGPC